MIRTALSVLLIATASAIKLRAKEDEAATNALAHAQNMVNDHDADGDGLLSREEFGALCEAVNIDPEMTDDQIDKLYAKLNEDNNAGITAQELLGVAKMMASGL